MEISVQKMGDKYIITEPDGTKREICPLYFGQMVNKRNGKYYYDRKVPFDYFKKAELLRSKGWGTGYHYEDWYELKYGWTEYSGILTDDAIKNSNLTPRRYRDIVSL